MLIIARVLQGAGGGGLQPSEQAILADTFPGEKRGMAFAMYGMAVVVAPAIGPTLGGWITDNFNWHWIFFINMPVGLLSLFLTHRFVEDPPWLEEEKKSGISIDYIGLALDRHRRGVLSDCARQRTGRRLVRFAADHDHVQHWGSDVDRILSLGVVP